MNGVKQVFLDLDGPLLDGKARHYFCYRSILEQFEFKPLCIDEYWEKKRALVNRKDLLRMSGAGDIYDEYLTAWLAMIECHDVLALDRVQDGAVDYLSRIRGLGVRVALVTMRKNRVTLEAQLVATGLRKFLDAVLVCHHTSGGVGKADLARGYLQRQINRVDTLWIGDTEVDWKAAKLLGCDVLLLANGLRNEIYLRSLHGAVVKTSIASLLEDANVS